MPEARFAAAISAIDAANSGDPNTIVVDGVPRPKELAHSEMMTKWVRQLDPDASEAQLLAARAHHVRRWTVPRSDYPEGRSGYLRWRTRLSRLHAELAAEILSDVGYEEETASRVADIVAKRGLSRDPEVQTHEDALCLVFLETQLADVATRLGADKTVEVLAKTLVKMSQRAMDVARSLPATPDESKLLESAIARASQT